MAANPDPKPGRWILPLVILGMIAFTYFFVSSLPEGSPTTTLALGTTTTTLEGTATTQPDTGTTVPNPAQAYIDELDAINAELQLLVTEMVTVNDGFDADPRTVEFDDAEARLETVSTDTQALADRVGALTPPAGSKPTKKPWSPPSIPAPEPPRMLWPDCAQQTRANNVLTRWRPTPPRLRASTPKFRTPRTPPAPPPTPDGRHFPGHRA
jgi:hypothetical protein